MTGSRQGNAMHTYSGDEYVCIICREAASFLTIAGYKLTKARAGESKWPRNSAIARTLFLMKQIYSL